MSTPTMIPTAENGTTAQPGPMTYVPPARQMTPERLSDELVDAGMNGPFIADLLSAMTAHERAGHQLYRSVAGRTHNPVLKSKYEEFGDETVEHVRILEQIVVAFRGDPQYVSPHARAVELMGTKTLESTFLLTGSVDVMTAEMMMLDAVVVAEQIDHANWTTFSALADKLTGDLGSTVQGLVAEVLEEEVDHLEWALSTRQRMTLLQADSSMVAQLGAKAEELVERVRNLLAD